MTFPATINAGTDTVNYNFLENTDRALWPYWMDNVGMIFGPKIYSYYINDAPRKAYYFPFPPSFTMEGWIKMDTVDPPPDGLIMTIFGKYTSSDRTD